MTRIERSRAADVVVSSLSVFAFLACMALVSLAIWTLLDILMT
jgi:hypothetical protein